MVSLIYSDVCIRLVSSTSSTNRHIIVNINALEMLKKVFLTSVKVEVRDALMVFKGIRGNEVAPYQD